MTSRNQGDIERLLSASVEDITFARQPGYSPTIARVLRAQRRISAAKANKVPAGVKMDERWKKKWPHLDLLRDCSESLDSCWLCDGLVEWNAALETFLIDLHEWQPGKICLAIIPGSPSGHQSDPHDTAFLAVWLLRKHRCIQALELYESGPLRKVAVPAQVAGFASNLREISFEDGASANWCCLLDAIGPINKLESFKLVGLDVSYTFAVKLAELLSANANSVRKVHVVAIFVDSKNSDVLMRGIVSCQNLKEFGFFSGLGSRGREDLAKFLQSNRTLKKFWLYYDDEKVEEAFCRFMQKNMNLTELHYSCRCERRLADVLRGVESNNERRISDVLRAVENDNVLEYLAIRCGKLDSSSRSVMEQGLRSVLSNNKILSSLKLLEGYISGEFGELIAAGLSENKTLELLDVSECCLDFKAVHSLCGALKINSTCSVKFGSSEASPLEREALARTLNESNLYGRVQLNWTDYDATGLCGLLRLRPPLRPIDLELNTEHLSYASFASLCQELSSSLLVSSLTVRLSGDTSEHVDSLCDALKKNASLKHVKLVEHLGIRCGSAVRAAEGLRFNLSVWHLEIICFTMSAVQAELLKSLVVENQRLNLLDLSLRIAKLDPQCMNILSQGMAENRFINSFHISYIQEGTDQRVFNDALMRNSVCLNRAVRFVLRRNTGKVCAEAFELFEEQLSLVARVELTPEMSDRDAKAAVKSAKQFISDNYFFINQVVRDKLECLPGEGTQIDQLNPACLRHIIGYLKVSDVIVH